MGDNLDASTAVEARCAQSPDIHVPHLPPLLDQFKREGERGRGLGSSERPT